LFERDDLGVIAIIVEVRAFADDFVVEDQDAAYLRIRRGKAYGFGGELEGSLHENFVLALQLVGVRHSFEDTELSRRAQNWSRGEEMAAKV
jgi:hypothetical protein